MFNFWTWKFFICVTFNNKESLIEYSIIQECPGQDSQNDNNVERLKNKTQTHLQLQIHKISKHTYLNSSHHTGRIRNDGSYKIRLNTLKSSSPRFRKCGISFQEWGSNVHKCPFSQFRSGYSKWFPSLYFILLSISFYNIS